MSTKTNKTKTGKAAALLLCMALMLCAALGFGLGLGADQRGITAFAATVEYEHEFLIGGADGAYTLKKASDNTDVAGASYATEALLMTALNNAITEGNDVHITFDGTEASPVVTPAGFFFRASGSTPMKTCNFYLDGHVEGTIQAASVSAVQLFGSSTFYIIDGTFRQTGGGQAIRLSNAANLTVNGGTLSSASSYSIALFSSTGTVTINGGTLKGEVMSNNDTAAIVVNGGTIEANSITGSRYIIDNTVGAPVTVNGKTVTGSVRASITMPTGGLTYNTQAQQPTSASFTISGLVKDTDYTVGYSDNTNAGNAKFNAYIGNVTFTAFFVIAKAAYAGAAPSAPAVSGTPAITSITLAAIQDAEYSVSGDSGATWSSWQDSPAFTGLQANTEYTFKARIKETANYNASAESLATAISTAAATQDNADITTAKGLIEGATYTGAQANITTIAQAKAAAEAIIDGLSLSGVTAVVVDGALTPATAGTVSDLDGTDGSYTFTVTLNKGAGTEQTSIQLTLVITATVYDAAQDNADITTAKGLVENETYAGAQANITTIAQAKAAAQAIIDGLSLNGVTAVVVDGALTPATAGTVSDLDGTDGSYTFTVTLNKGAGTQQTTIQLTLAITATVYDTTQDNADITTAKGLVENETYAGAQANITTIAQAKAAAQAIIDGLSLNGVTAVVVDGALTPATAGTVSDLDGTDGSYTFTVTLNKGAGTQQTTTTLTLTVTATAYIPNPIAPTITTATLAGGTTGTAYSATLTATGDATITWTKDSGNLPTGLTLNSNGTITGTPTTSGTFTFTVKATNGAGSVTKQLTIVITDESVPPPPKDGLSGGAIAGIVIGSVLVVGLGGFAIFWFVIKKKKFADLIAVFKKNPKE